MLAIQKYIKKHGIEKTITDFKLKSKDYPSKILLKYDMIESDMSFEEVRECRGIILEKNTWDILSYPFKKFFNYGETHADKIDLNTAKCLIKEDGTFINCYYDWNDNKWYSATTGMAEGEGNVNYKGITFSELFWGVSNLNTYKLNKDLIYMFELCTPENIVVTPHVKSNVILLGVRNRVTLIEMGYDKLKKISEDLNVILVSFVDIKVNSIDEIKTRFEGMPFYYEGYVMLDDKFNRVKIKNPAYVAAHLLKSKTATYHIMDIIKTNEIEEFGVTFKERKEELYRLKNSYEKLIEKLNNIWLKLELITPENSTNTQKMFADLVFKETYELKMFSGLFFGLSNGKINNVRDYIKDYDNKRLYELLN